jgi:hypothetical protein
MRDKNFSTKPEVELIDYKCEDRRRVGQFRVHIGAIR